MTQKKKPNFILIMTDQHRADHLGCYGHPVLRTPHIDSLAEQGALFDEFYVASPVCMPNRASLMTGRMPSVHGVRANGIPLSMQQVTFVELLREAGYATGLVGKSHLQNFVGAPVVLEQSAPPENYHMPPENLSQAVREHLTAECYRNEEPDFWSKENPRVQTPFYGFDHVDLVTGHGDGVGGDFKQWLLEREPEAASLLGPDNQLPHDYVCPQAVRTALPEALYPTSYIAERAEAFIKHQAAEQPFFLMVSFPDPHHPFNPPGRYWDMYRPEDMQVPEAFENEDWVPPPHVEALYKVRDSGNALLNGMNTIGVSKQEALEARALTCGMISMIDDAVGRLLKALDDAGERENTVILFTSDHGDHLGDHRLLLKGAEQYRDILRVPFIWSDPANKKKGLRTHALGSTIDIPSTILDRAEIVPFAGMQGRSLLPIAQGEKHKERDTVFIQYDHQRTHPGLGGPPRVHTIFDGRWRLSVFHGVEWGELYDLQADPGEFTNEWNNPEHLEVRCRLMEKLARAEIEHIDRVPLPTSLA
ncbi:sulfatase-like hydrolase/transferase [Pusillimonas sp. DMV24BSW_D]|uniref:sulfatase family protein n=1 Tax=Neopusillimonas aestuarii TaxID=2716226 RepID=UPI00140BCAF6|nr:sulfatase-like hydrolase/transferase [Pusillimonas sp. DMV24BSW_D]QIM48442.1 sulfatase-like hydrolase/transferase [Pusillimonas sp. DMV24BSW_D]